MGGQSVLYYYDARSPPKTLSEIHLRLQLVITFCVVAQRVTNVLYVISFWLYLPILAPLGILWVGVPTILVALVIPLSCALCPLACLYHVTPSCVKCAGQRIAESIANGAWKVTCIVVSGIALACAFVWKWSWLAFLARCLIFLAKGLGCLLHASVGRFFLYPLRRILARFGPKGPSETYAGFAFTAELLGLVAWSFPVVFPHLLIGDADAPRSRAVEVVSAVFIVGITVFGLGTVFWGYMLVKTLMLRQKVSPMHAQAIVDDDETAGKNATNVHVAHSDERNGKKIVDVVEVVVRM